MSLYLKEKNPNIKICLTDPCGAALYRYYTEGELRGVGDSITEGIGQGRVTGNMEGQLPHKLFHTQACMCNWQINSSLFLLSFSAKERLQTCA